MVDKMNSAKKQNKSSSSTQFKNIDLTDVMAKIDNREECIMYCQEQGINLYFNIGLYFPNYQCYGTEFFYNVGAGKKKVSVCLIFVVANASRGMSCILAEDSPFE